MTSLVSDSGPIISFARASQLELLRVLVSSLTIPEAVHREGVLTGAGLPGAEEVGRADWIQRQSITEPAYFAGISVNLGAGEREAIALARKLGSPLLIDERAGRMMAQALGVPTITTLILLADGKRRNHLETVRPALDGIIEAGFHLAASVYEAFLQSLGELDQS